MTGGFALGNNKSVLFFFMGCHLMHSALKAGPLLLFLDIEDFQYEDFSVV